MYTRYSTLPHGNTHPYRFTSQTADSGALDRCQFASR
uniref:Uncharacterized protein n=1 Tax=Anguilla anguilla TaxID=7936 RepID=A0A0E9XPL5_ANGAN